MMLDGCVCGGGQIRSDRMRRGQRQETGRDPHVLELAMLCWE